MRPTTHRDSGASREDEAGKDAATGGRDGRLVFGPIPRRMGLLALICIPVVGLVLLATLFAGSRIATVSLSADDASNGLIIAGIGFAIFLICYTLPGLILGVAAQLSREGGTRPVPEALRAIRKNLVFLMFYSLFLFLTWGLIGLPVFGLFIGLAGGEGGVFADGWTLIGMLPFLVIPLSYGQARLGLAVPMKLQERMTARNALGISWERSRGRAFRRQFFVSLLTMLLLWLPLIGLFYAAGLVPFGPARMGLAALLLGGLAIIWGVTAARTYEALLEEDLRRLAARFSRRTRHTAIGDDRAFRLGNRDQG